MAKTTQPRTTRPGVAQPKTTQPKTRPPGAVTILSLKVTLRGTSPPIWRRLLVADSMTLGGLHKAIQAAMGWGGYHLHAFDIAGEQYGDPSQADDVANEQRLTLAAVRRSGVERFRYTYDFGDDWEHLIVIETKTPAAEGLVVPCCIAGKRAGPPEDCGGIWGYASLLEVLANPAHPDHDEQREWVGEEFSPEAFDLAHVNAMLAARLGKKRSAS